MPPWVEHRWSCVSALIGRVRWPCMAPNTLLAANTQMSWAALVATARSRSTVPGRCCIPVLNQNNIFYDCQSALDKHGSKTVLPADASL